MAATGSQTYRGRQGDGSGSQAGPIYIIRCSHPVSADRPDRCPVWPIFRPQRIFFASIGLNSGFLATFATEKQIPGPAAGPHFGEREESPGNAERSTSENRSYW